MRTVFAVQSFKGTMSSVQAARIAMKELDNVLVMPVTDGGNGFLETVAYYRKNGKIHKIRALNANGNPIYTSVLEYSDSLYIESADIVGRDRISKENPILLRSTEGLGMALKYARGRNKRIYMGLGGSYTADIGYGMLRMLCNDVHSYDGTRILRNAALCNALSSVTAVADVKNTLEGHDGALMYAKQKGAGKRDIKKLEKYFSQTAAHLNMENMQSAGAAGGLGAACMHAGADIMDNMDFMDSLSSLRKHIRMSDTVITCEGMIDRQSFYGKITGAIIDYARKEGKRVMVVAGSSTMHKVDYKLFTMGRRGIDDPERTFCNILKKVRSEL